CCQAAPEVHHQTGRRRKSARRAARRGTGSWPSFTTLLHVVLDELLGVLFQDVVDLIDELVHVFLELLARFDDLGARLGLVLGLRATPPGLSLFLLLLHAASLHKSAYPRVERPVKAGGSDDERHDQ